jgi:non-heme chloroperoxidase
MIAGGESERLFDAYSIPSPGRPLLQTAIGGLNRRSPTVMDTENPDRGHSLTIDGRRRQVADFVSRLR